jgi:hypothetical protein
LEHVASENNKKKNGLDERGDRDRKEKRKE